MITSMTSVIGFRIDFYDNPAAGPAERSEGYLGSVVKEGAFRVQAIPRVGEHAGIARMVTGARGVDHVSPPYAMPLVPFLLVRAVEHYPVSLDSPEEPTALVVLDAPLVFSGSRLARFVADYLTAGWTWMPGDHQGLRLAHEAVINEGLHVPARP